MRSRLRSLNTRLSGASARSVLSNAAWLFGDKIVRLMVGVFINAWIARTLGPSEFGLMNLAVAFVAVFTAFSTMGLPDIVIRDFVIAPQNASKTLSSAFFLRLCGGVITIVLAAIFALLWRPGDQQFFLLVLIFAIGPLAQAADVIDLRYQADHNMRDIIILRNVAFVGVSLLRLVAIFRHAGIETFALLTSAELVVVAILMWLKARRGGRGLTVANVDSDVCRNLMIQSWPLLIRLFAIAIYMRIDQILLGRILGTEAVGVYSAAARISEVWYLALTAVVQAAVPKLASVHAQSQQSYEEKLVQLMRAMFWFSVSVAAVISVSAPYIVRFLYGQSYAEAADVLVIHVWAGVFVALGLAANAWFVNTGLVRFGLYQAIAGALTSLVANLILIPVMGVRGAAVSAILSYAVSAFLFNALSARTRPIFRIQLKGMRFS